MYYIYIIHKALRYPLDFFLYFFYSSQVDLFPRALDPEPNLIFWSDPDPGILVRAGSG